MKFVHFGPYIRKIQNIIPLKTCKSKVEISHTKDYIKSNIWYIDFGIGLDIAFVEAIERMKPEFP